MPGHADFAADVGPVLAEFGLRIESDPIPVAGGTLNWNFRAETAEAAFFVRRIRDLLESERIAGEHELVAWAAAKGLPVIPPLPANDGTTFVEVHGGRWAVYPWVDGEPSARGSLTAAEARALGSLQGQTHAVLARRQTRAPEVSVALRWDRDGAMKVLSEVRQVAERTDTGAAAAATIRLQEELLRGWDVVPPSAFDALPVQMLHGDFHDQQVLWRDGRIVVLVDWEIWHRDPRVWELLRSLAFSLILSSPLLEPYMEGYRRHVRLSEEECRLGLRLWWLTRVVGVWAWSACFLEGNERVAEFFPEMDAELRRIADEPHRREIEQRFLRAALH